MSKSLTMAMAGAALLALATVCPPPARAEMGQEGGPAASQQHQQGAAGTHTSMDQARVRQVQEALNKRGYDVGTVDGNWGSRTQRAVMNFQQAQGLEATGQLNQRTLAALGVSAEGHQGTTGAQGQGQHNAPGHGQQGAQGQYPTPPPQGQQNPGAGGQGLGD